MQDFEEHEGGTGSSPRRVGLLLGGIVAVAVVLFSLGVMVGKKANLPAPEVLDPPAALPTETLVPLSPGDLPSPAAREAEAEAAGEETSPAQKLTFFDRLSGDKAGEPALPKPVDREPPAAAPAAEKAVPEPVKRPPLPPAGAGREKTPPPSPASRIGSLSSGGPWAVQVSSGTNRDWSDDYVGKLKKRGLEARSVSVMLDGKRWYRIRIGRFPDRATAKEARQILESGFGLKGNVVQGD